MAEQKPGGRERRPRKGSKKDGRISALLLGALNHPVRREALRLLHQMGGPGSAGQLSKAMKADVSQVSYHLKVLNAEGVLKQVDEEKVRGATRKFFASRVSDNARLISILNDTEVDDRWLRKQR